MVQPKTRNRIVDALLELAAEGAWEDVTLERLAERSGVTLSALRAAYDGRVDVLADFTRRIDERVLAALDADMAAEAPRERLFDVLFSRIEALEPHRPAIHSLAAASRRDPLLALALNRIVTGSMGWMLAAAGLPATGGGGLARAQALAVLWARVLRVWLDDEDAGRARTMAELDRRLREAERTALRLRRLAGLIPRLRRDRPPAPRAGRAAESEAEGRPS